MNSKGQPSGERSRKNPRTSLDGSHRMQSEHPASEAETVIQRGRVFGGLEPTRAFGDARYKWPAAFQLRFVVFPTPTTDSATNQEWPSSDSSSSSMAKRVSQ